MQYQIQSLYRSDSTRVNSINYLVNRYGTSFARNYAAKSQFGAGWPVNYNDGYSFAGESGWQTWEEPIEFLRSWLTRRNAWMCEQWEIDMDEAYADSKNWYENPTTAEPTTPRPTTTTAETTTKDFKPQTYYDAWVNTERNLARLGTASDNGKHREGDIANLNDGIINVWDNRDGLTVDDGNNPTGSFDIALDKAYDASSIDQIVVYWRTGDANFYPQSYKVQFGYEGKYRTVATVTNAEYPTEGIDGAWGNNGRFVTDSDFTKSRLESDGVDAIRIFIDTPVNYGAQAREICVFAENPAKYPPDPTTTTLAPTAAPTIAPTDEPTQAPTVAPTTLAPVTEPATNEPTVAPTEPTEEPTTEPVVEPTALTTKAAETTKKQAVTKKPTETTTNFLGQTKVKKAKRSAKKIKIKLRKVKYADGYQVAVFKTKKDAIANTKVVVKKYVTSLKAKIKSKKIKKRKYFLRARAYMLYYGKILYGDWSAVKKVK